MVLTEKSRPLAGIVRACPSSAIRIGVVNAALLLPSLSLPSLLKRLLPLARSVHPVSYKLVLRYHTDGLWLRTAHLSYAGHGHECKAKSMPSSLSSSNDGLTTAGCLPSHRLRAFTRRQYIYL